MGIEGRERYIDPYTDFGFKKLKDYRDYYSTVKTAHKKGKAEGRAEERLANARRMKADNLPIELISKYTGLTPEEILAI